MADPLISNAGFVAFSCYPPFDDGRQYLISSVDVVCWQDEYYEGVWTLAWVLVSTYAFGLLTLTAWLLFLARKSIVSDVPSRLSLSTAFLHHGLKTSAFW